MHSIYGHLAKRVVKRGMQLVVDNDERRDALMNYLEKESEVFSQRHYSLQPLETTILVATLIVYALMYFSVISPLKLSCLSRH